jgi:two-component system KDP operon response regulator KdpE
MVTPLPVEALFGDVGGAPLAGPGLGSREALKINKYHPAAGKWTPTGGTRGLGALMTDLGTTVLVVDDEPQVRRFLRTMLGSHGFRVVEAETRAEGLSQASTRNPDLVLLDLGLPDGDGVELTRSLREWARMPIIVISARERERDKVEALDAGADDYLTKPFGADELLARMRVALRHATQLARGTEEATFALGELTIDFASRRVFAREVEVHLTPTEYRLLTLFVRHVGKVITHRHLLTEIWGPSRSERTDYLRVYMRQLRHKLEANPARPQYFINEPGVGYRLRAD